MPYDPQSRVWRPDFQANTQLPSWVPLDDDQSAGNATSSFVDALKARMNKGAGGGGHDMMHPDAMPPVDAHIGSEAPATAGEHGMAAPIAGAGKTGGPKSL